MIPDQKAFDLIHGIVSPWYESVQNTKETQEAVLRKLAEGYRKSRYGKSHLSSQVQTIDEFRSSFPIVKYGDLNPFLIEVQRGDYSALLPEPVVCWVMTRGSTGPSKVLPATKTHLEQIFGCGARALANHVLRKRDFTLLAGNVLNLNFPSYVHGMTVNGKEMKYGYSSGTYARLNPVLNRLSLMPRQEDIDALGSGITISDWEKRFELAYQSALHANVTAAMGVTPVILSFARYMKRKHDKMPKELWNVHALFCTSVRKIQYKYGPMLRKYFGAVPLVEIYSATEGVFAQQMDDLPYVTPNYDTYLFEVQRGQETIMLHELERGEWGRLIVSTTMLPRYDIGDMIESAGNGYFRIFGRDNFLTLLEHRLYRLFFKWFL